MNLRGVKESGLFTTVTAFTKLVPFAAISIFGLFYVHWGHFSVLNPSGQSMLSASAALAPLTMFAYLGLESATVPAGEERDPERTIPGTTMLRISIAGLVYVLGTVVVMGVVPHEALSNVSGAVFRRSRHDVGAMGSRHRVSSHHRFHAGGHSTAGRS